MKPPSALLKTALGLCLFFGTALAQPILTSYRNATAALRSAVTAFPDDQVESLDTLRRAEAAFRPLGEALEPTLQRGLNETFSRAEEAIVNQSETDLQVQAAVLQGGFGRAIYQQALENAADGDLTGAQNLLGVLGQDLGLADAQFVGTPQDALQVVFESRLAALSLEELGSFGGTLETRYRTLAQLYSYVFLVQDSPRLPPETRDTVVGTIRSLVAERPTDEGMSLLQTQLTEFAGAAQRTDVSAAQADGGGQGGAQNATQNTVQNTAQNATESGTANAGTPNPATSPATTSPVATNPAANTATEQADDAFVPPVALTPGDVVAGGTAPESTAPENIAPENIATENTTTDRTTTTNGTTNRLAQPTFPKFSTDPSPSGTAQDSTAQDSVTQTSTDQTISDLNTTGKTARGDVAVPETTSALPFLTPDVLALILAVAGLLALIGLVQLLFTRSLAPQRDTALALLLLPVLLEGLVALAGLLRSFVNQPWLEQVTPYSLFTSPIMQLVWVVLSIAAALTLIFGGRTNRYTVEDDVDEPEYAQLPLRQERRDGPQPQPQSTRSTPSPTPLTTGNLNWDEDF